MPIHQLISSISLTSERPNDDNQAATTNYPTTRPRSVLLLLFLLKMSVPVNSEEGKLLAKVKVGDNKLQALQRLGQKAGILADKDGIGLLDIDFITAEGAPYVFKLLQPQRREQEDPQARFRQLAESAAIMVTEAVMKSIVFHFSSQMAVVNTPDQAADLYKRASRIPRSATEIILREEGISVGNIFGGTDTAKSIILEAFDDGKPCLLKIAEEENIDHEMMVWEAITESSGGKKNYLVPIKKLDFKRAKVQVGNLSGGYNDTGNYRTGILMRKYQSTLSRCKIPLTEQVLLRYGEQLKTAISAMHERGYCHMDIKPANIFLWEDDCLLGDYGGATKVGERVREHTMVYYPSDAGSHAKMETDYFLLAVTLLEMFGSVASPPGAMTFKEIKSKVDILENQNVKAFLSQLVSIS